MGNMGLKSIAGMINTHPSQSIFDLMKYQTKNIEAAQITILNN